jgi:hypothetical protein
MFDDDLAGPRRRVPDLRRRVMASCPGHGWLGWSCLPRSASCASRILAPRSARLLRGHGGPRQGGVRPLGSALIRSAMLAARPERLLPAQRDNQPEEFVSPG